MIQFFRTIYWEFVDKVESVFWQQIMNYVADAVYHSLKKRKDCLEARAELPVLRSYVANQAIIEPIFLYRASERKQTNEQGSEDCLWTHIFTFL